MVNMGLNRISATAPCVLLSQNLMLIWCTYPPFNNDYLEAMMVDNYLFEFWPLDTLLYI